MDWKSKNVLVTGGAGVIGRELINELAKFQLKILCIDRIPRPQYIPPLVDYHQADLECIDSKIVEKFAPEIIFHLAASFERTEETPEFWEINFRDNVLASHKIIDTARNLKSMQKFIFASSYLIYSPSLYLYKESKETSIKLKEHDIIDTRNITGTAKYYTEKELEFVNSTCNTFTTISARIFRVYGCGSKDVISRWVKMALNGQELTVYNNENMFDYIFAGDVAKGLIKMAEKVDKHEIINLGTGTSYKIKQVISTLKDQIPEIKFKDMENDVLFEASCADMSKFNKLIGWLPETTLVEGIKKVVEFERKNLIWDQNPVVRIKE